MIGLDTNVLLRWLTRSDDPEDTRQAALAAETVASGSFHVAQIVLVEMVWTLRGRYGLDRATIAAVLRRILDVPQAVVERRSVVSRAVDAYEMGGAGFADHLLSLVNAEDGCSTTLTFDKSASRSDQFTLIA